MEEKFSDILWRLRKKKGFTQDELAEAAGLSRASIARYEAGVQGPTTGAATKIANALGVSVDYLLGNEDPAAQAVSDDDIKFALFGADPHNITDAQFEEVKRFAQFLMERETKKKHDK